MALNSVLAVPGLAMPKLAVLTTASHCVLKHTKSYNLTPPKTNHINKM
jgi:hypothetical protein